MPTFDSAIRGVIAEEVEQALQPYRDLLTQITKFVGMPTAGRGPGRPPKALLEEAPRRGRKPGRKPGRRAAGKGDASAFSAGQTVRYRQGRGEFEAKVVEIDSATNTVTVERVSDGKQVQRPAAKIYLSA